MLWQPSGQRGSMFFALGSAPPVPQHSPLAPPNRRASSRGQIAGPSRTRDVLIANALRPSLIQSRSPQRPCFNLALRRILGQRACPTILAHLPQEGKCPQIPCGESDDLPGSLLDHLRSCRRTVGAGQRPLKSKEVFRRSSEDRKHEDGSGTVPQRDLATSSFLLRGLQCGVQVKVR